LEVGGDSCNNECCGCIELDGLAFGAAIRAIENRKQDFCVLGGIASEEGYRCHAGDSDILRMDFKLAERTPFEGHDNGFAERGNFVYPESIGACSVNCPSACASQIFENSGVGFDEIWIVDSSELKFRSGGVQQRADDVENAGAVAGGEKFSDWHNGAKCGMAGWGEEEAAA